MVTLHLCVKAPRLMGYGLCPKLHPAEACETRIIRSSYLYRSASHILHTARERQTEEKNPKTLHRYRERQSARERALVRHTELLSKAAKSNKIWAVSQITPCLSLVHYIVSLIPLLFGVKTETTRGKD